ncbi:MAG: MobA/MobL family protein [Nitrososphaerota archaeon]|nr:MobA/MobL family protein [Nitrososphaerota archaeon]
MPIYYFDGNIIGRSSGRSTVGAAAYRAGEKLHSVAHASYQSGEKLYAEGDKITHDYTRKGGVAYSEIMLPDNAPKEYQDRETLWNAVERAEKRKDAQLAREFVVGLQREFELREQIEVLCEYIQESFVDRGMIADFSIHDTGKGNPHAHIMLTTHHVTPDGFGKKNTEWNENRLFLEWREGWADVNNRMFERLGLEERIDHRSYRDRGIDREPMIHLGYEAAALERRDIRTERDDHNREVQRRNEQRTAIKTEPGKETTENAREPRKIEKSEQLEKELQKIRATVQFIEKPLETEIEPPYVSTLERQLKAEKATQYIEKTQAQQNTAEKIAERMNALKEKYLELEKEKIPLIEKHNKDKYELPPLEYRAEQIDEHAENIEALQDRLEQFRESRRNLRLFDLKQKKETDEKIAQATQELERARDFFKNHFRIDPAQAPAELNRLQEEIRTKRDELNTKQILVQTIKKKQASIELDYHTQKLLNETRPDQEQITQLLAQMHKPPESLRDHH